MLNICTQYYTRLHKLPFCTMLEGVVLGETELWSSAFDPVMSPILSDPERQVILRWYVLK